MLINRDKWDRLKTTPDIKLWFYNILLSLSASPVCYRSLVSSTNMIISATKTFCSDTLHLLLLDVLPRKSLLFSYPCLSSRYQSAAGEALSITIQIISILSISESKLVTDPLQEHCRRVLCLLCLKEWLSHTMYNQTGAIGWSYYCS